MQCSNCTLVLERIEDNFPDVMMACHKTQMIAEDDENTITEKKIRAEIHQLGVKWA